MAMASYQKSKRRGRGFVVLIAAVAVFLMACAVAYSLTMRLYLHAYYCSAHAAGLSILPFIFLIVQVGCPTHLPLGCSPRHYWALLTAINVFYFLGFGTLAVCYTIAARSPAGHLDYDYVAAFSWYYADVIIMFALVITTAVEAAKHQQGSFTLRQQNGGMGNGYHGNQAGGEGRRGGGCCQRCSQCVCGLIFFLKVVLCMGIIGISCYHSATLIQDQRQYANSTDLHPVTLPNDGHMTLSAYIKCQGSGPVTVLVENDMGSPASATRSFLLSKLQVPGHQVCFYDRRGYGWTEGYETDNIRTAWSTDVLADDVTFLRQLIRVTNLATPLYYVGVNLGASHVTLMTDMFPEVVKAAILVRAGDPDIIGSVKQYSQVMANFLPTGLPRVVIEGLVRRQHFPELSALALNDSEPLVSDLVRATHASATSAEQRRFPEEYVKSVKSHLESAPGVTGDNSTTAAPSNDSLPLTVPLFVVSHEVLTDPPPSTVTSYGDLFLTLLPYYAQFNSTFVSRKLATPDTAATVCDAINNFISTVEQGG